VVNPDKAFFGQKDFQQFKVIEKLVAVYKLPVKLVMCSIVRDPQGLALSSRNVHLSPTERTQALTLFAVLNRTKENFLQQDLTQLKKEALKALNKAAGIRPEYFEICNSDTLLPALSKNEPGVIALVAAFVGNTRLIDNLILK
jgi:pantoate--beta-alanine ligase